MWCEHYSYNRLTEDQKKILDYFTEEEWIKQPAVYHALVNGRSTTVYDTVCIWQHWVTTGEFKVNYSLKSKIYFLDGRIEDVSH